MSRVLIAGGREESCREIAGALQHEHEVQVATDGWNAIELLYDQTPDALVAALNMDGVNGLGLIAAARDSDPAMPVVLIAPGELPSVDAVRFAAWDVLIEPFDREVIRSTVERAIDAHALSEEKQRLMHDLRRSNEFKGNLLRMLSHDLQNLLSAVKGFGYLALSTRDPDLSQRYVQHIMDAFEPMERMAEEFATYGLLDAHALKLDRQCFSLREPLETAVRMVYLDNERCRLRVPEDPPRVYADPARTAQVLTNLIGNAVKHACSGEIRVDARREGNEVVCSVRDQGPGIPRDRLESLFEPFSRLERDRSTFKPGRGLGLTIVKHLVELQGGRVWVESTVGKGSTFWFTLPAAFDCE